MPEHEPEPVPEEFLVFLKAENNFCHRDLPVVPGPADGDAADGADEAVEADVGVDEAVVEGVLDEVKLEVEEWSFGLRWPPPSATALPPLIALLAPCWWLSCDVEFDACWFASKFWCVREVGFDLRFPLPLS